MKNIFPNKYFADRTKGSVSIVEFQKINLFDQAALQLIGFDLAERLSYIINIIEKERNYSRPLKSHYPFKWSCIIT